ncbi:uncharacterized protein LY89DRAFT_280362 [Mollisia scopiformis]|uniref:Transcription factor RfeG n=1 Tax=Mollisia scopiformis TaxID=149040 RepID=A0A132B9Z0_MOLSC|nr:uncharacterized protein LY89DRAFT_280362 [Mollisia scopiformis]KUJ09218.1 hypothetical protein LY89DRAFT_280362 [Mollisia scopiformis]
MSRRDTDRDRRAAASARTNEYFVPKDGIDREVITADICRYLGNDALVRPGNYENPQTRQVQAGYFINAYRNLTTAMIADLKADSARWEAERRQTASRGQPANGISLRDSNGIVRKSNTPTVGYRDSATHQTRQYYGPSEAQPTTGYPSSGGSSTPLGDAYDNGSQFQQQNYAQPASGYTQPTGYAVQDTYYAGADYVADQPRSSRVPVTSSITVPRSNAYAPAPTYQQPDSRAAYYSGPPPVNPTQQVYATPQDPYYGRGASSYDTQDAYDSRSYQDTGYSQAPLASSSNIPATSNTSSRREREREPDRDSRSHHGRRR